ncbi:DUF2399 domain-containing protein [Actinomadura sp. KC345]|nr:DUF2399 domain-containing protein [Actinomadura sp. KC345]
MPSSGVLVGLAEQRRRPAAESGRPLWGPHPPAGRVTVAPWDDALAEALRDRDAAILEEAVAGSLLADLKAASPSR